MEHKCGLCGKAFPFEDMCYGTLGDDVGWVCYKCLVQHYEEQAHKSSQITRIGDLVQNLPVGFSLNHTKDGWYVSYDDDGWEFVCPTHNTPEEALSEINKGL